MTITITNQKTHIHSVGIQDLHDGCAYRNLANGRIYIGNEVSGFLAFSIDGMDFIRDNEYEAKFVEVDLRIEVIEI